MENIAKLTLKFRYFKDFTLETFVRYSEGFKQILLEYQWKETLWKHLAGWLQFPHLSLSPSLIIIMMKEREGVMSYVRHLWGLPVPEPVDQSKLKRIFRPPAWSCWLFFSLLLCRCLSWLLTDSFSNSLSLSLYFTEWRTSAVRRARASPPSRTFYTCVSMRSRARLTPHLLYSTPHSGRKDRDVSASPCPRLCHTHTYTHRRLRF